MPKTIHQEESAPSTGVFYIVREPDGWKLHFHRHDEGRFEDHSAFWEGELASTLASLWAGFQASKRKSGRINEMRQELEGMLKLNPYAFPRGRVSEVGGRFLVLHGKDQAIAKIPRHQVEQAFGIGKAKWEFDSHERCQQIDRDAVRTLLQIRENWKAVDPDSEEFES